MSQYTIGAGKYRTGTPYSVMRNLIAQGYDTLRGHGVADDLLRVGARIYARIFRQYHEQCGADCRHGKLHEELLQRVLNELDESTMSMRRNRALSKAEFTFGAEHSQITSYGMDPIAPALYPDPEPHLPPGIPEQFKEPSLWPIVDQLDDPFSHTHKEPDRKR